MQKQNASSSHAATKWETLVHIPFFTVEQLNNQFRIFNMTRYAQSMVCRNPPLTKNISLLDLAATLEPSISPISSPTYIPPHRRLSNPTLQAHPQEPPNLPLTRIQDKPLNIAMEAIDETWLDCIKKGVFAI